MVLHFRSALGALLIVCGSCGGGDPGPTVMMDFTRATNVFDAPFPSVDLQDAEGFTDVSRFRALSNGELFDSMMSMTEEVNGAGLSSPIHLRTTVPIDGASLPSMDASATAEASVFLMDVTESSPTYGARLPVYVAYVPDTLLYGTTQVISVLPLQGAPMRARTTYAAVVTTRVRSEAGDALVVARAVRTFARGRRPKGVSREDAEAYARALDTVAEAGVPSREIAGLAVFTTGDPGLQIRAVRDHALANVPALDAAFEQIEIFDTYCVFRTTVQMPVYQSGAPPFSSVAQGGRWTFAEDGTPVVSRQETARLFVTLPRTAVPEDGFPTAVFVRTGGGGDRPLIDRGPRASNGGPTITPGTGPAMHFAAAGFAGVQVDGPHGGPRNASGGDEQLLVFNVVNPPALRDNIRQSAVELMLLPHVLESVTIDASACPGVTGASSAVTLDLTHLTLMGHSMGATIGPIAVAHEPMYRAMLLSGAGGSYIENMLFKEKPLAPRSFFATVLGFRGNQLTRHDVALGLFQWATDSADPLSFLVPMREQENRAHVLMMQGIVDHYIMPSIANATSLGLGLSLAGPSLDAMTPEISDFTPLADLLPLVGAQTTSLPASGNIGGTVTAVVTQHAEDGIEDGHEVVFQTDEPKHEYECFLRTLRATGVPVVPAPGAACP